jgi:4-hydroxybenzoate polyprenyltransferase
MWQDWVIAACQWGFAVALLPTLFGDRKPEVITALMTAILAAVVALTLFTIPLFWAAIATGSTSVIWFIITAQSVRQKRQKRPPMQRAKAA